MSTDLIASESPSTWVSYVWFTTKVIATIVIGLTALLYFNQNHLIYMPNPPGIPRTPKENPRGYQKPSEWTYDGRLSNREGDNINDSAAIEYEEDFVVTRDKVRIHTWLLFHKAENNESESPVPTLIYFHGNAGNMGFRLPNAVDMLRFCNINILMMDYRGYGSSEGQPDERGLQLDAEAVLEYANSHPRLKGSPIILFGRSLGGAVSIYLAKQHPADKKVHGVVLENTFLSIQAMAEKLMPAIQHLAKVLGTNKWSSDEQITDVLQPILFISGQRDELVPPEHMHKLFELAGRSAKRVFFAVRNGRHNDTWEKAGREYYRKLKEFIDLHILQRHSPTSDENVDKHAQETESEHGGSEESGKSSADESEVQNTAVDREEDDYVICDADSAESDAINTAIIPTMTTDFQVKSSEE